MGTAIRNRRPLLIALAAMGIITAGVIGVRASSAQPNAKPSAPQAMPVAVAPVVEAEVATWDEFSGRLEAVERVDVRSRVAGALQSVHFTEGALVRKGDLLVTIDPAPFAAEAERAEAQVVAAKARLDQATSELERAKRLWQESAIAQRELDERVNGQREAQANLRAAEAALQAGERDAAALRETALRAMHEHGVEPDYLELVSTDDLSPVARVDGQALLAVAARVGPTRLIDNTILSANGKPGG